MTENEYFLRLEFRICGELFCMREKELRGIWCDGFIPDKFEVIGKRCRITGRVWLVSSGGQKSWEECWDFALLLGSQTIERGQINWDAMMPGDDVTGWLSLDFQSKFMKIDPLAAYPDPQPAA